MALRFLAYNALIFLLLLYRQLRGELPTSAWRWYWQESWYVVPALLAVVAVQ